MKRKLKQIIGIKNSQIISWLFNRKFQAHRLSSLISPKELYSDFFIYNSDYFQNIFIAENIFALIKSFKVEVIHSFKFFNKYGQLINIYNHKDDNYISKINLPKIKSGEPYLSFTHQSIEVNPIGNIFSEVKSKRLIGIQHRGYTLYKKEKASMGNIVHGNFGAIYPEEVKYSAAVLRNEEFCYTPIYIFKANNKYHLVFNNPTHQLLEIQVVTSRQFGVMGLDKKISIKPFGIEHIELKGYEGSLSFISLLPICRCVVFKNPGIGETNFDVFHS